MNYGTERNQQIAAIRNHASAVIDNKVAGADAKRMDAWRKIFEMPDAHLANMAFGATTERGAIAQARRWVINH